MESNRRILLIEDNEQNRYLTRYLLEARGWEVVEAVDGPTGLRLANEIDPTLILLDIQLPGMDGYAVARALRQLAALRAIPLIAVTSYAMPGDREQCLAAGCSGYLEKPIDPQTFAEQVEAFMESAA
ncbi:MAG: response regulator [Gammaproteobacteria bacterium]|nr:response regulator [Gammaproteobacteria bacterium]